MALISDERLATTGRSGRIREGGEGREIMEDKKECIHIHTHAQAHIYAHAQAHTYIHADFSSFVDSVHEVDSESDSN